MFVVAVRTYFRPSTAEVWYNHDGYQLKLAYKAGSESDSKLKNMLFLVEQIPMLILCIAGSRCRQSDGTEEYVESWLRQARKVDELCMFVLAGKIEQYQARRVQIAPLNISCLYRESVLNTADVVSTMIISLLSGSKLTTTASYHTWSFGAPCRYVTRSYQRTVEGVSQLFIGECTRAFFIYS